MTKPTEQDALKPEPDLSWIDIAVTRNREVTLINFSEGWREFIECIWWEDNFVSDPPNLAPGAYRWSGYQINLWAEDEHCNVTGGTFTPYRTEPSANCSGEPVAGDMRRKVAEAIIAAFVESTPGSASRFSRDWRDWEAEADAAIAAMCTASNTEALLKALGQIAGKNDLSGVPDDEIESAARHALYECELIARQALSLLSKGEQK